MIGIQAEVFVTFKVGPGCGIVFRACHDQKRHGFAIFPADRKHLAGMKVKQAGTRYSADRIDALGPVEAKPGALSTGYDDNPHLAILNETFASQNRTLVGLTGL